MPNVTKITKKAPYAYLVTPSDTLKLSVDAANTKTYSSAVIYTITAGNVKIITTDGQTITMTAVPAYTELPFLAGQVLSTGTTATCIALVYTNG